MVYSLYEKEDFEGSLEGLTLRSACGRRWRSVVFARRRRRFSHASVRRSIRGWQAVAPRYSLAD